MEYLINMVLRMFIELPIIKKTLGIVIMDKKY